MSSTLTRATSRSAGLLALVALPWLAQAQTNTQIPETITKEGWLTPPPEVSSVVMAPRYLNVSLNNPSPTRKQFLRTVSESMPTQALFARPHYFLGGLQVDYRANRARALTTRGGSRIELISPEAGKTIVIAAPSGGMISSANWSPDGSQVSYLVNFDDGTHIYVADAVTGKARQLTKAPLLATLVTQPEWGSNARLFAVAIPFGRPGAPVAGSTPTTPQVRVTSPAKNPQRTYNPGGLLEWPIDMDRLEYYTTGQLVAIDVAKGTVTKVGNPAMIQSIDAAPDGNYIRVTMMQKPFSYIVPTSSFGTVDELWSVDGKVKVLLSKRALREGSPADTAGQTTRLDKRNLSWRPDGQGLSYLLQEPAPPRAPGAQPDSLATPTEGRPAPARRKDRVYHWVAPFDANSAKVVYENDTRIGNVRYSDDAQILFITEGTAPGGGFGGGGGGGGPQGAENAPVHEYAVYLNEPAKKHTLARYRPDDFYNLPGTLLTRRGTRGIPVVQTSTDGSFVFLQGTQYSKNPQTEAPRPFLDKIEIRTGKKERVFQSSADVYESIQSVLDDNGTRMIVDRESPNTVADAYLRDANGQVRKLTNNRDYSPEITAAPRKLVEVTRADGFKFWVRVTLPPSFSGSGAKPPAMFWFYPREFDTQEAYDRTNRAYNKNAFPNVTVRDMDILTKLGYTVVEPDAPITGPTGRMNDNYVNDLRNNLAATIDELDRLGYIDRTRLGVGGHSYGAFSTVNAMVHTPFFKAGIAGDGNYNRTLTPNAFQSERRMLWEARETYLAMSPFLYANNLTGALLMYHGMADQNVGTDPINSYRLFNALEGLGKTASLYMYPFEDHGPATKETNLDMWARWVSWLDTYVKNANKKDQPKVISD